MLTWFKVHKIVKEVAYIYCQNFINYYYYFIKLKFEKKINTSMPNLKRYYNIHKIGHYSHKLLQIQIWFS